jgi:molecular chaperone DnaJ
MSGSSGFSGQNMNMDDIFSMFGDIFGGHFGGFGGFGGGGRSHSQRVSRGQNLRVKVKLTLKEIVHGAEKKIKVSKYVSCSACSGSGAKDGSYSTCSTCHGTGQVTRVSNTFLGQMQTTSACPSCGGEGKIITNKCTVCYGEGIVKGEEVISLNIPAGVAEGMQLSMSGKGNAARRGGINGDLIVLIQEEEHPELIRDENDLIYNLYLNLPELALGTTAEIPTVDSKVKVKIDSGTQPEKILRLRGKGIPDVNGYGKGDLLVRIHAWVPTKISNDEKALLEKIADMPSFKEKPDGESAKKDFFKKMRGMF